MEETNPIEESLSKIEVGIRQLKIQYDMYFSGVLPRQPFEARKEIEILIYNLRKTQMQRFSDRFRYNTLASKFQTMIERWGKMLRAKEEGRLVAGMPGFGTTARTSAPATPASAAGRSSSFRFRDPASQDELCRMFYDEYIQAARLAAPGSKQVSYSKFRSQIQNKTEKLKSRDACEAVVYKIERKGKRVILKARPLKPPRTPK